MAVAARDLDGAVDVTLTTGTTRGPDRGALYVARCAEAVKEASGLPVQAQFEPPEDLSVLDRVKDRGVDSVGMHVESFDPAVLAHVAPAKARTGIEGYFRAWERAVQLFGPGQVSTYVILGMGEDPEVTVRGCQRAMDIGVYPFIVPLRPVPGSLMEDVPPPAADYMRQVYRQAVPLPAAAGPGVLARQGRVRALQCLLGDGGIREARGRGVTRWITAPRYPARRRPLRRPPRRRARRGCSAAWPLPAGTAVRTSRSGTRCS